MENKPLVSTITPCYQMKRYLKLFLEELPKQTIFNKLEVVLDHNDPDEEEVSWVKQFQTKHPNRLVHIITRPVSPIGTSMNMCIRSASGKYLTIWNVDDLRTPHSLETQVYALESHCADIAYGDYEIVHTFGPAGSVKGKLVSHSDIPESEFTRSMIFGPFVMFTRTVLSKSGVFDEQLVSGADFDLCVRLAFNGKAVQSTEVLGYYLNEGKGASTRPNSKQKLDRTLVELRYGIYDKIDYDMVPEASTLHIHHIYIDGVAQSIEQYLPHYKDLIKNRLSLWKSTGLRKYAWKKTFYIYKIKNFLKSVYKKIITT